MKKINADMPFIEAPQWALLERSLIDLMNDAVELVMKKYVHPDGSIMWPTTEDFSGIDGLDDAYESFHNWPLLYLLGGDDKLLHYSHRTFAGITRQFGRHDCGHGHPMVVKEYEQGYDWMHQGEGYLFFYSLCMADPENARSVERARKFAGFYLNEDPQVQNYDAEKKLLKCPHVGSMGPAFRNFATKRVYGYEFWQGWPLPFLDIPGCDTTEDLKKPGMAEKMGQAMNERQGRGDVACNLAATSLVANAYMCSGEDKYREWVREYLEAWIERTRANKGILPDNVGLSGAIGEYLDGKWYGGNYGWSWPSGWHHLSDASISASENAVLLYGDRGYLELPRSQVDVLMEKGEIRGATLHVPHFYNDRGWEGFSPMEAGHMTHIWCMSMAAEDMARLKKQRHHEARDWLQVRSFFSKHGGGHEAPWVAFLEGEYPDYPEAILRHNHAQVRQRLAFMRDDTQDPATYGDWYLQVRNPVSAEGLIQLTMGGPLYMYNGGLLQVRLRYFDWQRRRPGLPPDVAALVEKLEDERTVVRLLNLSATAARELVVQGGAYGEHRFTRVSYQRRQSAPEVGVGHADVNQYREMVALQSEEVEVEIDDKYFLLRLEPGAQIRLDLGMERFVNDPSYALPWAQ